MMTTTKHKITAVLENSFGKESDEDVRGILVPTPRATKEANKRRPLGSTWHLKEGMTFMYLRSLKEGNITHFSSGRLRP